MSKRKIVLEATIREEFLCESSDVEFYKKVFCDYPVGALIRDKNDIRVYKGGSV